MTVATSFFNWQTSGLNPSSWPASPNLLALRQHLLAAHGGQYLGGKANRPIVGGTSISTHAFDALDWRYQDPGPGRAFTVEWIIPWLIDHSAELGIDAIHDYAGSRIWRAGRTSDVADAHGRWWKQQAKGSQMGQAWALWLHIESHRDTYHDARPIPARLAGTPAPPKGITVQFSSRELVQGSTGNDVRHWQTRLNVVGSQGLTIDGQYGPRTATAVRNWQVFFGLHADGQLGPITQRSIVEIGLLTGL